MMNSAEIDTIKVRSAIIGTYPGCPNEIIEQFLLALSNPSEKLISKAKLALEKPYGNNFILYLSAEFGVSFAQLLPMRSTSLHFHFHRRELFFVRQGKLHLKEGEKIRDLGVGEWANSSPKIPHSISNMHTTILEVVEIFSPGLLDDKYRLSDTYHRPLGNVSHRE